MAVLFLCISYRVLLNLFFFVAPSGSTVVEYLPHQPKVKGLSPAPPTGTERENGEERFFLKNRTYGFVSFKAETIVNVFKVC